MITTRNLEHTGLQVNSLSPSGILVPLAPPSDGLGLEVAVPHCVSPQALSLDRLLQAAHSLLHRLVVP